MDSIRTLGLKGWLKFVFQTRAATIRQCDRAIDEIMSQTSMYSQQSQDREQKLKKLAMLCLQQHTALVLIETASRRTEGYTPSFELPRELYRKVVAAIEAGQEQI